MKSRSRRETESDKGVIGVSWLKLHVVDPKPGDLIMVRLKLE